MSSLLKSKPQELSFLPENAQWKNRFEIKSESSNRLYTIAQNKSTGVWGCSCPGWIIHRNCKHLRAVISFCKEIEYKQTKTEHVKQIDEAWYEDLYRK